MTHGTKHIQHAAQECCWPSSADASAGRRLRSAARSCDSVTIGMGSLPMQSRDAESHQRRCSAAGQLWRCPTLLSPALESAKNPPLVKCVSQPAKDPLLSMTLLAETTCFPLRLSRLLTESAVLSSGPLTCSFGGQLADPVQAPACSGKLTPCLLSIAYCGPSLS